MWTRKLLKDNAKMVLSRTYWLSFAVILVHNVIINSTSSILSASTDLQTLFGAYVSDGLVIGFSLLSMAFTVFVGGVLGVGLVRFFMEARGGNAPFKTLFSGFDSNYLNVTKIQFFVSLKVFLWTLLLIIPGVIKSIEYSMVPYILAENPSISSRRAFELSKAMTDGEKMDIFVLGLSFIGWNLLGALACGVGVIFVAPYMQATYAELYTALRTKVMANGYSNTYELPGFIAY